MAEFAATFLSDFWSTVVEMAPYLLFGFFVAGLLSVLVSQALVERHLGGRGIWQLVKASVFGVPLPLCSCGVIPVSMSLHKHGASKGASVAFLLSTPQTGVDSILVTFSLLGGLFALFRPVAAFVTGIIGGVLVNRFAYKEEEPHKKEPVKCTDHCCSGMVGFRSRITGGLKYAFVTLPRDIGPSMLVGLVIAAVIAAFVPDNFFAEVMPGGIWSMLIMMVVGIPIYVCATASVPIAAALILKGLSPGAALVFLMTGPATNAASLATIWNTLGRRTAIIYLLTVAGCALGGGLLLNYIGAQVPVGVAAEHASHIVPHAFKQVCAVVLLLMLGYAVVTRKRKSGH